MPLFGFSDVFAIRLQNFLRSILPLVFTGTRHLGAHCRRKRGGLDAVNGRVKVKNVRREETADEGGEIPKWLHLFRFQVLTSPQIAENLCSVTGLDDWIYTVRLLRFA